jgi:hypothetical protein
MLKHEAATQSKVEDADAETRSHSSSNETQFRMQMLKHGAVTQFRSARC